VKPPDQNPFVSKQTATPGTFTAKQKDASTDEDCEPGATMAELKVPQRLIEVNSVQTSGKSKRYMLGPRGGCFYLTASGGKKYVDRGLCSQPMVAAQ
jgi:hypothetical protein